jgi:hypothetical protein
MGSLINQNENMFFFTHSFLASVPKNLICFALQDIWMFYLVYNLGPSSQHFIFSKLVNGPCKAFLVREENFEIYKVTQIQQFSPAN